MAFQRSLVLVFCLVAVITNVVTMGSARELNNNPSDHEKGVNNLVEAAHDPSMNKEMEKNQLGFLPIPFPRFIPGFPFPIPVPFPVGARMNPNMLIPPEEYYNYPGVGVPSRHAPTPPPK